MYGDQYSYEAHDLEQCSRSGARWFFWIAGLSIITSIVSLFGGGFVFFLSLGTTQFVDGVARGLSQEFGDAAKIVALVFDLLIAGLFALMGWFALKRHLWSFIVGMSLFVLDALVLLIFQIWLSFAFHLLVVFWIFKGFQAARQLVALERERQLTLPPQPPAELSQPPTPAGIEPGA
jgi:hypothetical protein